MVLRTYELLIIHQVNTKFASQMDVNVKRLERTLEQQGFHIWKDKDPKRFQEGVDRSKIVIACVSRQSELSRVFNEQLHCIIRAGKPVVVVTVEPDYVIPALGESEQLSLEDLTEKLNKEHEELENAKKIVEVEKTSEEEIVTEEDETQDGGLYSNVENGEVSNDVSENLQSESKVQQKSSEQTEGQDEKNEDEKVTADKNEEDNNNKKTEETVELENIFAYLNHFKNFVICGKVGARTNVNKMMEHAKSLIREQCKLRNEAAGVSRDCFCWICKEIDDEATAEKRKRRETEANQKDGGDENIGEGRGGDEIDGQMDIEEEGEGEREMESFFVAVGVNRGRESVLLADGSNKDIREFHPEQGLVMKSSVGELRGIQDLVILESNFILVSQTARLISGQYINWISILNEDMTEIKVWDTLEEITNPTCMAVLRNGDIAIVDETDSIRQNIYSRVYIVSENSPRVRKSFQLNMHHVTSLDASPFDDVIVATSWRTQQVRMFDLKGRQLWFLIWKDDLLLRAPSGIAFLSADEILLCDRDKHSIYLLETKSGKTSSTLEEEFQFCTKHPRLIAAVNDPHSSQSFIVVTDNTPDPKFIKLQNQLS